MSTRKRKLDSSEALRIKHETLKHDLKTIELKAINAIPAYVVRFDRYYDINEYARMDFDFLLRWARKSQKAMNILKKFLQTGDVANEKDVNNLIDRLNSLFEF